MTGTYFENLNYYDNDAKKQLYSTANVVVSRKDNTTLRVVISFTGYFWDYQRKAIAKYYSNGTLENAKVTTENTFTIDETADYASSAETKLTKYKFKGQGSLSGRGQSLLMTLTITDTDGGVQTTNLNLTRKK